MPWTSSRRNKRRPRPPVSTSQRTDPSADTASTRPDCFPSPTTNRLTSSPRFSSHHTAGVTGSRPTSRVCARFWCPTGCLFRRNSSGDAMIVLSFRLRPGALAGVPLPCGCQTRVLNTVSLPRALDIGSRVGLPPGHCFRQGLGKRPVLKADGKVGLVGQPRQCREGISGPYHATFCRVSPNGTSSERVTLNWPGA